jgi:hypothetical protein
MSRQHHYYYAHRHLPAVLFQEDDTIVKLLFESKEELCLRHLQIRWEVLGENFEVEDRVSDEGLALSRHELIDGYQAVLIQLPPPREPVEAFMVVVIRRPEVRGWFRRQSATLRYFTLELGVEGNVLCEWQHRDSGGNQGISHLNYGEGPAASPNAFLNAVEMLLKGGRHAESMFRPE